MNSSHVKVSFSRIIGNQWTFGAVCHQRHHADAQCSPRYRLCEVIYGLRYGPAFELAVIVTGLV